SPHPRRRITDPRVISNDNQVARQCDVAAARDGVPLHLRDRGLQRPPQREEVVGVAAHLAVVAYRVPYRPLPPPVAGLALGELLEVIAGAERPTRTLDDDDAHAVISIGLLDGGADLARH